MKILFICTHNRCRSILAEAITNHIANGRIYAASAGSQPAGEVHPLSLKYLQERGIKTASLRSQSWDDFEDFNPDAVITVCDNAAQETCPLWIGNSVKVHWGLADPSKLTGTEEEKQDAFRRVMDTLEKRIKKILSLDLQTISNEELKQQLQLIALEAPQEVK